MMPDRGRLSFDHYGLLGHGENYHWFESWLKGNVGNHLRATGLGEQIKVEIMSAIMWSSQISFEIFNELENFDVLYTWSVTSSLQERILAKALTGQAWPAARGKTWEFEWGTEWPPKSGCYTYMAGHRFGMNMSKVATQISPQHFFGWSHFLEPSLIGHLNQACQIPMCTLFWPSLDCEKANFETL